MTKWSSRGLRGSALEELVNYTNEDYRQKKLCLVQKIPTPITPIEIDQETRHITLAYFEKDSTVDYIGAVQGIPICFDCKECEFDTFPLANIHEHQYLFMKEMEEQDGVAFLLISFTHRGEIRYLPFKELKKFWERMENGGRKSFKIEELNDDYIVPTQGGLYVRYLDAISKDLASRGD